MIAARTSADDLDEVERLTADGSMTLANAFESIATRTGRMQKTISRNYHSQRKKKDYFSSLCHVIGPITPPTTSEVSL